MVTKRFRFSVLALALILAGVFAFQTLTVDNVKAAANSPVGSWKVTVSPTGMPSFISGVIFSSDGTVTMMEYGGVVGLGVWEKLNGNQYAFTVWEYYLQGGTYIQAKLISTFRLSHDKEQYDGPFFFQITDVAGNLIIEGSGTASGVRNHVEPMPGTK